jgi:hypothetical protein
MIHQAQRMLAEIQWELHALFAEITNIPETIILA